METASVSSSSSGVGVDFWDLWKSLSQKLGSSGVWSWGGDLLTVLTSHFSSFGGTLFLNKIQERRTEKGRE